jgi:hypothetical protein
MTLSSLFRRISAYPRGKDAGARRAMTGSALVMVKRVVGLMIFEISIPDDWPPGLGLAIAKMVRQSLKEGFPIIVPVRKDATPEQLQRAFEKVRTVIEDADLAA